MFVLVTGFVPNTLISQVNTYMVQSSGSVCYKKFMKATIEICDLNGCLLLCPAQLKAMTTKIAILRTTKQHRHNDRRL
jgi:hypothetical protein